VEASQLKEQGIVSSEVRYGPYYLFSSVLQLSIMFVLRVMKKEQK